MREHRAGTAQHDQIGLPRIVDEVHAGHVVGDGTLVEYPHLFPGCCAARYSAVSLAAVRISLGPDVESGLAQCRGDLRARA